MGEQPPAEAPRGLRAELRNMRRLWAEAPTPHSGRDLLGLRRNLARLAWFVRREHSSPGRLAAAVLVGIFVGCSPFFGLHLVLCLLVGLLLRLNKLIVYAAANISLPIFAPLLIFACLQAGSLLLTGSFRELSLERPPEPDDFVYWLCGWPPVALALGVPAAGLTWLLARWRQSPSEPVQP